jgi:hypothetical protein
MQNFAKARGGGRPVTPQDGQPSSDRRADAANARVKTKNGLPVQIPTAIPARGLPNAQNSSAPMQPGPQRRVSGQAQGHVIKRDPYDTDAESIDTTINQSVVQVEDSQKRDQQHQQNGQVVDFGSDEEEVIEEEGSDEGDEPGDEYAYADYVFTAEDEQYLRANDYLNISRDNQLYLLQQAARSAGGLPTVEGDSYPTTTNGDPSEWGGGQEAPFDFHDDAGQVSPSPQRPNINSQPARSIAPQQQQQQPKMPLPNPGMQKQSYLFQQGAGLRDQARSTAPHPQYGGQHFQHHALTQPSSQPPTYSQANPPIHPVLASHPNTYPNTHGQISKSSQHVSRQPSGPSRAVQFQTAVTKPVEQQAPLKRMSSARAKPEPVVQQQPIEQAPIEEVQVSPDGDYDHDTLFEKKYEDLKNEDFDTDPRAKPQVLLKEDLEKPFVERLGLVQKNLDAGQQSDFFRLLPTGEWEDAGDWFLDQFQSIIQRTKQARQSKRKLAQDFENEVEKRHKHVSKKRHQVEQAMDKMKAQGEGLVPRSPRPSKSPRVKRA